MTVITLRELPEEPEPAWVEAMAREIYLSRYEQLGGNWGAVETKDVWHSQARAAYRALRGSSAAAPAGGAS